MQQLKSKLELNILISMTAIIIIIFAIFNGQVINWQQGKTSASGWHITSFILRACLILQASSIGLALIYGVIAWAGYNLIINLIIGNKLNYFGKYDFIKGWLYWTVNIAMLVSGIYLIIK